MKDKKPNKKISKETIVSSLSGVSLTEIKERVNASINNRELQKSIEKWLKENEIQESTSIRDIELLSSITSEYLDTFITFGYNIDGERVIIQNYPKPKDRDAMMEFLKIVFAKYNQGIAPNE